MAIGQILLTCGPPGFDQTEGLRREETRGSSARQESGTPCNVDQPRDEGYRNVLLIERKVRYATALNESPMFLKHDSFLQGLRFSFPFLPKQSY